ncbi:MAG: HAD family hydrolase [Gaiellaceae bacterium]
MSDGPLVMLDIGSTLVAGPDQGPARRIAVEIGLSAEEKRALHRALMTIPFGSPSAVSAFVRDELGRSGDAAIERVWAEQEGEAEPIDGALEALERLSVGGVRFAIVSNIWQPFFDSARRHLGRFIDENVPPDLQLLSFRTGVAKPAPEIFERALDAAGVGAADAVMVGDSYEKDIEPARALGIGTIQIGTDVRSVADVGLDLVYAAIDRGGVHAHPRA